MNKTIRILTILAAMIVGAGQAWATDPTYGKIIFNPNTVPGMLAFCTTRDDADRFFSEMNSTGGGQSDVYDVSSVILTDDIVYVRAMPYCGYTVKGMTITVTPSVGSTIEVTAVEGHPGVFTFPMPTDGTDVTVTASFPVSTPISTKYIDADGVEQQHGAYVLDGAEQFFGKENEETWYVCNSNLDYPLAVRIEGKTHLILADGAAMTVGTEAKPMSNNAIFTINTNLTIYGQSAGTGSLSAVSSMDSGAGIHIQGDLTINGGRVTASSTGTDGKGIHAVDDLTINGGQVEATGTDGKGISADGKIILGWTKASDYIKASSYFSSCKSVVTAAGQRFLAYKDAEGTAASTIISGTISEYTTSYYADADINGKTLRPLAVTETVDGVTTTSPAYCLSVPAGTVVSGKTEADGKTPKPDITIGGKPYYLFKNGDNVTFTLEDRGQDGVEVSGLPIDLAVTDRVPTIEFDMGTDDVNVTAKFYLQQTGVDYLDWDVDKGKFDTKNTKDLSTATKVYILDGTETTLGKDGEETWYVCTTAATENDGKGLVYTSELKLFGDVRLILADGAAMTCSGMKIDPLTNSNLTIYGQSDDEKTMGKLTATNATNNVIHVNNLTINGGIVEATANSESSFAIITNYYITINGGHVIATNTTNNYGINTYNEKYLYINGGKVESNGIFPSRITFGWTAASDFIQATSYDNYCSAKIPAGKALAIDGTTTILDGTGGDYVFGASGNATLADIAGKKLIPAQKKVIDGEMYIAYSSGNGNWKLNDADAQVYVITGYDLKTGKIILTEVTGNEIPDGMPVIIAHKGDDGSALPDNLWLVGEQQLSTDAAGSITGALKYFVAGDGQTTLQGFVDAIAGSADTPVSDYVAFILDDDKFKPIIMNASSTPSYGACLLILPKAALLTQAVVGSTSAARMLTIDLGGNATSISEKGIVNSEYSALPLATAQWYDLQGRRLSSRPTAKGIYIHNGRTFVVQ